VLLPHLRPGNVVILDNLSTHKSPPTRQLIESAGAQLVLVAVLPDCMPTTNAHFGSVIDGTSFTFRYTPVSTAPKHSSLP